MTAPTVVLNPAGFREPKSTAPESPGGNLEVAIFSLRLLYCQCVVIAVDGSHCEPRELDMSFVGVAPEHMASAAQDLAGIRSALGESYAAAAAPTTGLVAAAEDEVSTAIASAFGAFGRQFQVISAQVAGFHDEFVNLLNAGAGAYISTEVANVKNNLLNAVNAPAKALSEHPSTRRGAGATGLIAALQAAEPELAKAGGELTMARQSALGGVAELRLGVTDLVKAGDAFVAAGTDAGAALSALETAAADLGQGVDYIAQGAANAASGLGLLGTAVAELFSPAFVTAVPSALAGVHLLKNAAVELVHGVQDLISVGKDAATAIAELQSASPEFTQAVSDVMLAQQLTAHGLAALQTANTELTESVNDVKMAVDTAAATLGF